MADIEDPNHPGWAIWARIRVEHREDVLKAKAMNQNLGLPPVPPYEPLPEIPPPGHLDFLVRSEAEEIEEAKTFTYWETRFDKQYPGVIAQRNAMGPKNGAVVFDGFLSGRWIFDPKQLEEIRHQAFMEPHWELRQVDRAEAERIEASQGRTLPSVERLLEICEGRIGAMYGSSATPDELAERQRKTP